MSASSLDFCFAPPTRYPRLTPALSWAAVTILIRRANSGSTLVRLPECGFQSAVGEPAGHTERVEIRIPATLRGASPNCMHSPTVSILKALKPFGSHHAKRRETVAKGG
jgi:hypothetical protein